MIYRVGNDYVVTNFFSDLTREYDSTIWFIELCFGETSIGKATFARTYALSGGVRVSKSDFETCVRATSAGARGARTLGVIGFEVWLMGSFTKSGG